MGRVFKYKQYLDKYKNCPHDDCTEKDIIAYRWVHQPLIISDFEPILINSDPPPRVLGKDDELCTGYALSLFIDFNLAKSLYIKRYDNQYNEKKRISYKKRLGTHTAKLAIEKEDGVSDNPKESGHFNFFEYAECNLLNKVVEIIDNFV
jgi:hypothetical protein